MSQSVFILGRQPAIGRAEIERLFGSDHTAALGNQAMLCDRDPSTVDFARIGSATRLAKLLGEIDSAHWNDITRFLIENFPRYLQDLPAEGKVKIGISAFDIAATERQLLRTGLELKKVCKQAGRSVRLVPNAELALSSAQVMHNNLTSALGVELLLIRHGKKTILAQTVAIQDINAYAKRDQGRPKRDAFVGMLPPKLAQTIVNLAVGQAAPALETVVLDPFCGTGVVLQEATLMGFQAYGSDLEPRMIDYTQQNMTWLHDNYDTPLPVAVEVGDATTHQWKPTPDFIACEAYLGHPLATWPRPEKMQQIIGTCNVITEKFMRNLADQIPSGTELCVAVPAWINPTGRIYHLPVLDHLEKIGYNRVSFRHVREEDLVYHRSDQIVGRELLVITRK